MDKDKKIFKKTHQINHHFSENQVRQFFYTNEELRNRKRNKNFRIDLNRYLPN